MRAVFAEPRFADRATPLVSPRLIQKRRAGLVLAAPAAILLILLLLLPSSAVLYLSLTDYELGFRTYNHVGLANYRAMFADPAFRQTLANTFIYVAAVAPASVILALVFALMIEARSRGSASYRIALFLPVTATLVAMATAWEVLLHPTFGFVNTLLALFGLDKVRFFADPDVALYAIAAIGIWKQIGFNLVLFLAGLATIPRDLYEAAALDGADAGLRRFQLVSWPMLGPVTVFVVVITLIRAFSEFETIAVLTDGGPVRSTTVILFALHEEAFRFFKIGLASAIAVTFLVFVATLSIVKTNLLDRRVHYR
jgi:multiple sugar transport system permease protein